MANRALIEREIKEYCKVNGINNVAGFITQCLLRGFNIFRYGNSPSDNKKRESGEIEDKPVNRVPKSDEKSVVNKENGDSKIVVKRRKRETECKRTCDSVYQRCCRGAS